MKPRSKSIFNIFTLIALLVSLIGSTALVLPVQTVAAAASKTSSLSANDLAQIKALLPAPTAAIPNFQQTYLKASNTETEDKFGLVISFYGDTLVVGAPYEDSNATGVNGNQTDNSAGDSGAVYVFTRTGGVWSQQAYLKASNTEANDLFGFSVSISGDTLVVGAPGEASNATGVNGNQSNNSSISSGAAYVFTRNGRIWSQQAYLKASNTEAGDGFGGFISLSENTLLVGAAGEDSNAIGVNGANNNSATESGAAYVFTRNGTTWSQQAYLKASNTGVFDQFGTAVSLSGDIAVVGAHYESSNSTGANGDETNNLASSSGAAYVFTRSGTTWSQQAYLKASNTEELDHFGDAVAVSGDTITIGAAGEDSNATGENGNQADNSANGAGAAYVFTRNGTTWNQQAYLKASNTGEGDNFGISVSLSGDTFAVGAAGEDSNANGVNGNEANNLAQDSGATYIFTRTGITWSQQAYLKASNTRANDHFGSTVSVSDYTFIVGAYQESSNATGVNGNQVDNTAHNAGAVYSTIPIFTDVPFGYWASTYIDRLYNAGITGGCSIIPLNYCPDSTVTRAQMAVFLLKGMHGSSYTPPAVGTSTGFTDVATDYWAAAWIKQLAAEGITGGCGSGNYCPDTTVTRAQMAVFLLKAEHGSSYSPPAAIGVFTDVPTGYWAASWIEQLAVEGITGGCGTGTYCPDISVTRAQMAVFLVKAFNLP